MAKKRILEVLDNFLQFLSPNPKKKDLDVLSVTENPNDILGLINKFRSIAAKLEESGDSEAAEEILAKIAKLKILLLNIYRKKKNKLLLQHHQEISEENARFLKGINKQLENFKKHLK